ncbi:DUF1684 domain-containing protein [Ferruginibacter sp.]|nr:DUF1684 domain-containing protein [Ferruginibacter sp.]
MRFLLGTIVFFLFNTVAVAQKKTTYTNSINSFQKKYVATHEVVKGKERKLFRFFAADENFKIQCRFESATDTAVISMKTSGKTIPQKDFKRYGKLLFTIHDTALQLTVYQSVQQNPLYKNYLFIPFTDVTTGDETYGSGRYIDIETTDIKNNMVTIDFNKAYNPYCAYSTGYNCPVPPKENYLVVAIKAGEKNFAKSLTH